MGRGADLGRGGLLPVCGNNPPQTLELAGHADLGVLADGVELVWRIAVQPSLSELISEEVVPGREASPPEGFLTENVRGYFHPVDTRRMGAEDDADAVVDPRGAVRGVDGLHVRDASVIPTIPRANANLTTIAIAEQIV